MDQLKYLFSGVIASILILPGPAWAQVDASAESEWRVFLPAVSQRNAQQSVNSEMDIPKVVTRDLSANDPASRDNDPVTKRTLTVGSILVESQESLDHSIFDQVIESFLGKETTNDDLAKLAQEIATIARDNGMVLAEAHVPEQDIEMGIVKVVLSTGVIDEVRIEGSSNRALRKLLDPLAGNVALQKDLERRLILASNIPQVWVKRTELIQEGGRRILLVQAAERKKVRGQVVVDNFGSKRVGPLRARVNVETVALLDDSDNLSVTLRTNPSDPGELVAASTVYGIGLNNNGTRAEVTTAWSKGGVDPQFGFGRRDGTSSYASLSLNHPLRRSRTDNIWVDGQFEYLNIEQESFGALLQSDTVVTLSVGLSASTKVAGGWMRAGTQIRQGLGVFGAKSSGDPLSSRFDADGKFTSGRAWISWTGKPVDEVTLRLAVSGQVASEPLLSSEEVGLGGAFLGRGFEFYERSGDHGVMGLAEIGYEFSKPFSWMKRLQPYAFIDGGYVGNLNGGYGSGTLMSAGGGVRADIGRLGVQLETAVPVSQSGRNAKDSSPKVNLQVGLEF